MAHDSVAHETLIHEFTSSFTRVWETQLELKITEDNKPRHQPNSRWLAGVVWLGGQWTGSVTLALPEEFAITITAKALEIRENEVSIEQAKDYLRELANMCAGNLKSALPGPCGLATPGCFEISSLLDLPNDFPLITTLNYVCDGKILIAELRGLE